MRSWWKARAGWLLLAVPTVVAAFALLLGHVEISVPNVTNPPWTNSFSLGYALGFLSGLVWLAVVEARVVLLERTSVRRLRLFVLDLLLALGPSVASLCVLLLVDGTAVAVGTGRNLVIVAAAAVVANCIAPRNYTFLVIVAYLLVAATCGFGVASAEAYEWALLLDAWEPSRDWSVITAVITLAIVTKAVTTFSSRLTAHSSE